MDNTLEIELRAKIDMHIADTLLSGKNVVHETYQHDVYYKYPSIPENTWIVRIREEDSSFYLTYKSKNQAKDGAWSEVELPITSASARSLHDFFLQNGYGIEVEINKSRKTIIDKDLTVNIDEIKNLGQFIEVEIFAAPSEIDVAQDKIKQYLKTIGVPAEAIVDKGYVALMKEVNNHG